MHGNATENIYHPVMRTTHLLYLHGFRSSPASTKARKMAAVVQRDYPGVTWWCPQLPPSPRLAMAQVMAGVSAWPSAAEFQRMAVVGSSLGGFYATWVAEKMACKAVVLNPAVCPARDLGRHIGEQSSWHDPSEKFFFNLNLLTNYTRLRPDHSNRYTTIWRLLQWAMRCWIGER